MRPKAILSWSSGKDSALSLQVLRQRDEVDIIALATTFTEPFDRVAMHGVRMELVEQQARAAGLPLWRMPLPWPCPNATYEMQMQSLVQRARALDIRHIAFGDLFLSDIRTYREHLLANTGVTPLFPIWDSPANTAALARSMIASGMRAVLTCVDPKQLSPAFSGREFDAALLADLPATADPCGERGEFHTFCYAGPCFDQPIPVRIGESVEREGFWFTDLTPADDFPKKPHYS
jgi:uncharacterized protein (TIGR00290 family)